MPQIEREYVTNGKIRYTVREFPLEQIHPQAFRAAQAALCAGDQGKYWEMHVRLFANQRALGPAELPGHARAVGLDETAFGQCLESGRKGARVRADLAEGQRAGISGTPTFFVGIADGPGNAVKVVRIIRGAQPYPAFKAAIDAVLAEAR
jgi:protein-disulfide isomerase